tara:strand:- start:557 stop:805 length:249 start_codon:yes stop_codon:yes gene_type:complete
MKIEILMGSNYPDGEKDIRVEEGDVIEVPDKIAKSLIKNNAAIKFDSKIDKRTTKKRARNEKGHYIADNPETEDDEAWTEEG